MNLKEAKEHLVNLNNFLLRTNTDIGYTESVMVKNTKQAIEIVLNLTEKQRKIIDKMAEQLAGLTIFDGDNALVLYDKEFVKEYFENKVQGKEDE